MNFLYGVIVIWNDTTLRIKQVWEESCREMISMAYIPTCTCGLEGVHSRNPESGHPQGRSLDMRSKDVPFHLRMPLLHHAQQKFGSDYLVLLEDDHYHIQRQHDSFGRPAATPKSVEV